MTWSTATREPPGAPTAFLRRHGFQFCPRLHATANVRVSPVVAAGTTCKIEQPMSNARSTLCVSYGHSCLPSLSCPQLSSPRGGEPRGLLCQQLLPVRWMLPCLGRA